MVRIVSAAASAFLILTILAPAPAGAQQATCGVPVERKDGWPVATPAGAGIDNTRLCAVTEWLKNLPQSNVHSIVVARRGALVFEQYFAGADEAWGNSLGTVQHGPNVKHDLRSITKSVVATLVGIAIDRKLIASVDEPVFKFYPEHADLRTPEKDRIRLRHLLTMSAGFAWNENLAYGNPENSERRMTVAPSPYRYTLEQPVADPPGVQFTYSGGATQLLAGVVQKTAGKPLEAFAREALFEPLGIGDVTWVKMPNGDPSAASGLRLTARDLAKIGQLVLTKGEWNGRRIVSAEWIAEATTPAIEGFDFLFYGYQWWLGRALIDGREVPWIAGLGLGGQRLFIVPSYELVVAINAGFYTSPMQRWVPWLIFRRYVMNAVRP
jgi:CubicO group peptidase (beta-lactamase class C family)